MAILEGTLDYKYKNISILLEDKEYIHYYIVNGNRIGLIELDNNKFDSGYPTSMVNITKLLFNSSIKTSMSIEQLIFVTRREANQLEVSFVNNGCPISFPNNCVNALFSLGYHIKHVSNLNGSKYTTSYINIIHQGKTLAKLSCFNTKNITVIQENVTMKPALVKDGYFVNCGNKHVIVHKQEVMPEAKQITMVKDIRSKYSNEQINVSFISPFYKSQTTRTMFVVYEINTYEYGVNKTNACGSASMSACRVIPTLVYSGEKNINITLFIRATEETEGTLEAYSSQYNYFHNKKDEVDLVTQDRNIEYRYSMAI